MFWEGSIFSRPKLNHISYYIVNLNGDFHDRNSTPEILKPKIPIQINLSINLKFSFKIFIFFIQKAENVSQIFLHQISINSLFKHVFDSHILNFIIFGNITNGFQINLDTRSLGFLNFIIYLYMKKINI